MRRDPLVSWQEDEAVFGLGELADFQADADCFAFGGRFVASVALIQKGQFDVLLGGFLNGGKGTHLCPQERVIFPSTSVKTCVPDQRRLAQMLLASQ